MAAPLAKSLLSTGCNDEDDPHVLSTPLLTFVYRI